MKSGAGEFSMLELFRQEARSQLDVLVPGLLALERGEGADQLDELMRAAHSLKGAASIVGHEAMVRVAHVMEDVFVAAQAGSHHIDRRVVDTLLRACDLLGRLALMPDEQIASAPTNHADEIDTVLHALRSAPDAPPAVAGETADARAGGRSDDAAVTDTPAQYSRRASDGRSVLLDAERLNKLLGLASESLVSSRWPGALRNDLVHLKRVQDELRRGLDSALEWAAADDASQSRLRDMQRAAATARRIVVESLTELEVIERRSMRLASEMYDEVLSSRMRPFAEGVRTLPRLVRDTARDLGKEMRLELVGEATPVDREILQRTESALGHLVRNSVDHGIEQPAQRRAAGKPAQGLIRVEARHSAGVLLITVSDDGRGIDTEIIRAAIVQRQLADAELAARMTEAELLEFLFLPGFSLRTSVTALSGRGVGLDAVQTTVREMGGTIAVTSRPGQGIEFQLQLPLTLSVVRALVVDIGGEPYGVPLARIARVARVSRVDVASVEGREHVTLDGHRIGLVPAHQILDVTAAAGTSDTLAVIVLADRGQRYGLVVDELREERQLAVLALDARLGKVKDIAAAAVLPDGGPVLIMDVDDVIQSIQRLVVAGRLQHVGAREAAGVRTRRRVLVVDDSLTVRETERKLLESRGYDVEIAVDGLDGWNAARTGHFDLVVTDVDMPRMDGIELLRMIRSDARLTTTPVIIVSYKDRDEDRRRGLETGADYYLTKASFQDETFLEAVRDLIGGADA